MSDESSICGTIRLLLAVEDFRKTTFDYLEELRERSDKRRGYKTESIDIEVPRDMSLTEIVTWATNLRELVPVEYADTAVVDIWGSEDVLEADISWRVPLK